MNFIVQNLNTKDIKETTREERAVSTLRWQIKKRKPQRLWLMYEIVFWRLITEHGDTGTTLIL